MLGARARAWGAGGLRAGAFGRAPLVRRVARVSFLDVTCPPRTGARGPGLNPLLRGFGSELGVGPKLLLLVRRVAQVSILDVTSPPPADAAVDVSRKPAPPTLQIGGGKPGGCPCFPRYPSGTVGFCSSCPKGRPFWTMANSFGNWEIAHPRFSPFSACARLGETRVVAVLVN